MFSSSEIFDGVYRVGVASVESEIVFVHEGRRTRRPALMEIARLASSRGSGAAASLPIALGRKARATGARGTGGRRWGASEADVVAVREARLSPAMAALNAAGEDLLAAFVANRCVATRNALVMHYAGCARTVARRVYKAMHAEARRLMEREDVEQVAITLLHPLLERYDASRGIPLSGYIRARLGHALIDEFRSAGVYVRKDRLVDGGPRVVSLDQGRAREGTGERKRIHVADRAAGPVRAMEIRGLRRELLRAVPRELRLVVALRVFRGKQIWQVARRLHVTCAEAQAAFEAAASYLRAGLGGEAHKGDAAHRRMSGGDAGQQCVEPRRGARAQAMVTRSRGRVGRSGSSGRAAGGKCCGTARAAELLPSHLRREKAFRRWVVLNVPWAYRRFVAYHHLRGMAVERVAEKLGVPAEKAWDMERVSKRLISQAVEAYSETQAVAA